MERVLQVQMTLVYIRHLDILGCMCGSTTVICPSWNMQISLVRIAVINTLAGGHYRLNATDRGFVNADDARPNSHRRRGKSAQSAIGSYGTCRFRVQGIPTSATGRQLSALQSSRRDLNQHLLDAPSHPTTSPRFLITILMTNRAI